MFCTCLKTNTPIGTEESLRRIVSKKQMTHSPNSSVKIKPRRSKSVIAEIPPELIINKIRKDANGNNIVKGGKKFHVTFKDQVKKKEPLVIVIDFIQDNDELLTRIPSNNGLFTNDGSPRKVRRKKSFFKDDFDLFVQNNNSNCSNSYDSTSGNKFCRKIPSDNKERVECQACMIF